MSRFLTYLVSNFRRVRYVADEEPRSVSVKLCQDVSRDTIFDDLLELFEIASEVLTFNRP